MIEARKVAQFSKQRVGAAGFFLNEKNQYTISTGAKIEIPNLTLCPEQIVIGKAVSTGYNKLLVMAIAPLDIESADEFLLLCGACRQLMNEFAELGALVVVDNIGIYKLSDLLPKAFKK